MALSKKKQAELREEKGWEGIDHAVVESENFLIKYQKQLLIAVAAFVIIACGYLGYNNFIVKPAEIEAEKSIFKGEEYYRIGQDSLALFGDPNGFIGFESIIDKYGNTKTGNLAKYYSGLCYANMGNNEKALERLKSYSGKDLIVAHLVNGAIGTCLDNTGKQDDAIAHYLKAAKGLDNAMQSPIFYKKAGLVYRSQGKNDKVIEMFSTIKEKYMNSPLAAEADKYIEEAKMKGAK